MKRFDTNKKVFCFEYCGGTCIFEKLNDPPTLDY